MSAVGKPHAFKPGQSGNPSGRPKNPPELKDCTPLDIKLLIWKLWKLKRDELHAFIQDPNTTAGQLHVAAVLAKGIKEGDQQRLDYLLNRLVGKVKEEVEITQTKPFIVRHLNGSQTVLGASLEKKEEDDE